MSYNKKDKVNLEDLLKFKKAETPSADDWKRFDDQLKSKIMLSIVRKEPFYKRVLSSIPSFGKALPAGAAALLCVGLLLSPVIISYSPQGDMAQGAATSYASDGVILPNVDSSFATNEFSAFNDAESPVSARLNSDRGSLVSYVSGAPASHLATF